MSEPDQPGAAAYSLFAEFYDLAWADYAAYCHEIIQAAEESSLRPFRRICDAACGTGKLLEKLARDGGAGRLPGGMSPARNLLGFDRSGSMLQVARARTAGLTPPVQLRQADLRDTFPFHGPIDLVTCMHDSLNYLLDPEDIQGFLQRVRRVLAPNGVCIFDVNAPELYADAHGEQQEYLLRGQRVQQSLEYRPAEQLGITRFRFPSGTEEHWQRAYTRETVDELVYRAGLHLSDRIEVADETTGAASGKVLYVAVRA